MRQVSALTAKSMFAELSRLISSTKLLVCQVKWMKSDEKLRQTNYLCFSVSPLLEKIPTNNIKQKQTLIKNVTTSKWIINMTAEIPLHKLSKCSGIKLKLNIRSNWGCSASKSTIYSERRRFQFHKSNFYL